MMQSSVLKAFLLLGVLFSGAAANTVLSKCLRSAALDADTRSLCQKLFTELFSAQADFPLDNVQFNSDFIDSGIKRKDVDHVFLRFGRQM